MEDGLAQRRAGARGERGGGAGGAGLQRAQGPADQLAGALVVATVGDTIVDKKYIRALP